MLKTTCHFEPPGFLFLKGLSDRLSHLSEFCFQGFNSFFKLLRPFLKLLGCHKNTG
jgi:hypothetical protein